MMVDAGIDVGAVLSKMCHHHGMGHGAWWPCRIIIGKE